MNRKERITLDDNITSAVMKMAGGNPGAITALMELSVVAAKHDPDSALGVFGPMLTLDSFGIYESDIWLLYNDVCSGSTAKVATLLRAVQMGMLDRNQLFAAIKGCKGEGPAVPLNFPVINASLRERLPQFVKVL